MKFNKLFMGLFGALALTACSSEEVINTDQPNLPGEGEARYMSVTIRNANPGTRAGGDQLDGDGGGKYEEGFEAENKVNSLRFYFFDADGNAAPIKYNGESYYTCSTDPKDEEIVQPGTSDMPNVESILDAVIVIESNTGEGDRNSINQIVAIVNFDKFNEDKHLDKNLSLSELTAEINSEEAAITDNGFLMTSASFYADKYGISTEVKPEDIKATRDLALANPVDVYVERVVAKVRVTTPWDGMGENEVIKGVTFEGETYTAVALKDQLGNAIRVGNSSNDPQVYAIFQTWDLWWTADKSYLFKKVDDWDQALAWRWNHPAYFRSYWAENPANVTLAKHNHLYPSRKFGYDKTNYADYSAYCLENAADPNNGGFKKGYNPKTETTNRTLVYLKAKLVTLDGNTAKAVDLAEWAGYKYTKENLISAMLAPNVNEFYFLHKEENVNDPVVSEDGTITESGSSDYTFITLRATDLQLVTGIEAGMATDQNEESKRYLSYIRINPATVWNDKQTDNNSPALSVEEQLYQKVGETEDGKNIYKKVTVAEANKQLQSVGGAKVWDGGDAYYYHEITHLGKTAEDNTKYGVVRNHIYEIELNTVTGLGTPVLSYKDEEGNDVWEEIIPQKPTPDAYFLGARLNILSWRVVNQSANLNW